MNYLEMFSLKDKVAIITGGERGIGLELAIGFAKAGADIVIAGLMDTEFENAIKQIEEQGRKCYCFLTDVSKEEEVSQLVKNTLEIFQRIDILVNNAGIN